jgi:hypothetical protein
MKGEEEEKSEAKDENFPSFIPHLVAYFLMAHLALSFASSLLNKGALNPCLLSSSSKLTRFRSFGPGFPAKAKLTFEMTRLSCRPQLEQVQSCEAEEMLATTSSAWPQL